MFIEEGFRLTTVTGSPGAAPPEAGFCQAIDEIRNPRKLRKAHAVSGTHARGSAIRLAADGRGCCCAPDAAKAKVRGKPRPLPQEARPTKEGLAFLRKQDPPGAGAQLLPMPLRRSGQGQGAFGSRHARRHPQRGRFGCGDRCRPRRHQPADRSHSLRRAGNASQGEAPRRGDRRFRHLGRHGRPDPRSRQGRQSQEQDRLGRGPPLLGLPAAQSFVRRPRFATPPGRVTEIDRFIRAQQEKEKLKPVARCRPGDADPPRDVRSDRAAADAGRNRCVR